jgi:hypothetical protein
MTDQELIARLLDWEEHDEGKNNDAREAAANRIAELVKERDELGRKLNTARYGQPDFAWSIHEEAMADLRAKLTKAVETLRFYSPQTVGGITFLAGDDAGKRAHKVLAEIERDAK